MWGQGAHSAAALGRLPGGWGTGVLSCALWKHSGHLGTVALGFLGQRGQGKYQQRLIQLVAKAVMNRGIETWLESKLERYVHRSTTAQSQLPSPSPSDLSCTGYAGPWAEPDRHGPPSRLPTLACPCVNKNSTSNQEEKWNFIQDKQRIITWKTDRNSENCSTC